MNFSSEVFSTRRLIMTLSSKKTDFLRHFKNKLFLDTGIYTIGAFLQKGVSFLLIPLYIAVLTPGEYGIIDFAATLVSIFGVLFSFGLGEAFYTSYYHYQEEGQGKLLNVVLNSYLIIAFPMYLATLIVLLIWCNALLGTNFSSISLMLIIFTGFFSFFSVIFSNLLKLNGRSVFLAIFSLASACVGIGMNVILVYFMRFGVLGVFVSNFFVAFLSFLFLIRKLQSKKLFKFMFNKQETLSILKVGFPFIFTGLSYWILNGADRMIIINMLGEDRLGIYSLASKFAFALHPLLITPVLNACAKPVFKKLSEGNYNLHFKLVAIATVIIFALVGFGIMGIAYFVIKKPEYMEAIPLIPIFVLGTGFNFIAQYGAYPLVFNQKVKIMLTNIFIAGSINIILNFILIKHFNIRGAAYAYLLGNICWASLAIIQSMYFIKRRYDNKL